MKTLDEVRENLLAGEFDLSDHAFVRAVERNISDTEVSDTEVMEAGNSSFLLRTRMMDLRPCVGFYLGWTCSYSGFIVRHAVATDNNAL